MSEPAFSIPVYRRIIRIFMRSLFRGLFHILSQVRISGKENVPQQGAYLVVSNHISVYEPPFILAFWPETLEAAGAVEIWERPGQNILVRLYGAIPVHRGEYDRRLIENLIAVLKSGRPLLIAPEGGRTHTTGMRRANPGAAYIVDQACVPVVPVGILGTSGDLLRHTLHRQRPSLEMRIGVPFTLPPLEGRGEARRLSRQRNADIIMQHIADLLPPEYHGEYAEASSPVTSRVDPNPSTGPQPTADART